MRLVEGDPAAWVVNDLEYAHPPVVFHCAGPDRLATDLIELIHDYFPAASALSVSVFEGSSLVGALPALMAIVDLEIEISRTVWARYWSQWSENWETRAGDA